MRTNRMLCLWCKQPLPVQRGPGRPRKFCRRSHRQRHYEQRRRGFAVATLMEWAARFDFRCYLCGKQMTENTVEFDHVVPTSKQGTDAIWNLRPCCRQCNLKKAAKFLHEL